MACSRLRRISSALSNIAAMRFCSEIGGSGMLISLILFIDRLAQNLSSLAKLNSLA